MAIVLNKPYHRDVYFPDEIKQTSAIGFYPHISKHARIACKTDRLGYIILPISFSFIGNDIVEFTKLADGLKFVIRQPYQYDDRLDIVFVLLWVQQLNSFVLKTVWLNRKTDTHKTLDTSKYVKEQ